MGCNKESIIDWQNSIEGAVEAGLIREEAGSESVLSIEEFEGETFVFYEHKGGLGVANIVKSEKGYGWNRSEPYLDFVGAELPFSSGGYEFETETGLIIYVTIGKAFDSTIKEMQMTGDGTERKLQVRGENRFFYALHKLPFNQVDLSIVN